MIFPGSSCAHIRGGKVKDMDDTKIMIYIRGLKLFFVILNQV